MKEGEREKRDKKRKSKPKTWRVSSGGDRENDSETEKKRGKRVVHEEVCP